MKISFIVDGMYSLAGTETHIRDLGHELLARGHQLSIITGKAGIVSDVLQGSGVEIVECPEINVTAQKPHGYLKSIYNLTSIIKKQAPDVVHSHSPTQELPCRFVARLLNIPSVHTAHLWAFGDDYGVRQKMMWGAMHGLASVFNNSGHTIFVSDFNREHSLKRGYVGGDTSSTIHNGIPDIVSGNIGNSYKGESNSVKLVMVARFAPEKDQETVLKGLSQIKELDWEIDFAGNGDKKDALLRLVRDLDIESRCNFLGQVSNIPELLSEKDILVHGAHREPLGIALIEGMRASLPVVASQVGGIPELVSHGRNGYLFPDNDADTMAGQLAELIRSKNLRHSMGEKGREMYKESFQAGRMASKTESVYESVLKRHNSSPHIPRKVFGLGLT